MSNQFRTLVCDMFDRGIRFDDARAELERVYIERAVASADGSLSRAAEVLGIHRNTLRRKLAEHRRAQRRYSRTA